MDNYPTNEELNTMINEIRAKLDEDGLTSKQRRLIEEYVKLEIELAKLEVK